MSRTILIEIGDVALPNTTPPAPFMGRWFPVPTQASALPQPVLVASAVANGVLLTWSAGLADSEYVIEVAPDAEGAPGVWSVAAVETNTRYTFTATDTATRWYRVTAKLRGRPSIPSNAVSAVSVSPATAQQYADLSNDNLLTPDEKPRIIQDRASVLVEQTGLDAQAVALGVTTEKTAYDNAISALTSHLGTLTTPVLWSSLAGNTVIVGATFRQKWIDVAAAKQALLNRLTAVAATKATWSSVSGTGKPADNADVTSSNFAKGSSITDTRATNELPSWYRTNYGKRAVSEFKATAAIGLAVSSTYCVLYTDTPWNDISGGVVRQEAVCNEGIYQRVGAANDASWGSWARSYDEQNKPTWGADLAGRPAELTDGRIANGLQSDGKVVSGKNDLGLIADGGGYSRTIQSRVSGGKPFVDLSESVNLNRNLNYIEDTATYRKPGAGYVDASGRVNNVYTSSGPTSTQTIYDYGVAGKGASDDLTAIPQIDRTNKRVTGFYGQGALATKGSVDLATGEVVGKVATNITWVGGGTVESLKPAQAGADATAGKSIDVLVDGTTYRRTGSGYVDASGRITNLHTSSGPVGTQTVYDYSSAGKGASDDLTASPDFNRTSKRVTAFLGQGALATKNNVDLSTSEVVNKSLQYVVYGGGRYSVNAVDALGLARINFADAGHVNKSADYIAESATRKWAAESGADKTATAPAMQAAQSNIGMLSNPAPNLIEDPYFQTGGWFIGYGGSIVDGYWGRALVIPPHAGYRWDYYVFDYSPYGVWHTLSGGLYIDGVLGSGQVVLYIEWLNAAGVPISSFSAPQTSVSQWDRVMKTDVPPAGTAKVRIGVMTVDIPSTTYFARPSLKAGYDGSFDPQSTVLAANGLRIPGSGRRVGDQRNLPRSLTTSYGAVRTATALSATSAGAVSVNAHTVNLGGSNVTYSAVANAVTGLSAGSTYVIYCDDPGYAGGTCTWFAGTNPAAVMALGDGIVVAGEITIPTSGSSSGGFGGIGTNPGDWCVDWDTVLPDGRFLRDVAVGDEVLCVDVRSGVRSMEPMLAFELGIEVCFRVLTANAAIVQSKSTPMDMRDGSVCRTTELLGREVLAHSGAWETVIGLECVGERVVIKPNFGNRMFFAGETASTCLATHNANIKP